MLLWGILQCEVCGNQINRSIEIVKLESAQLCTENEYSLTAPALFALQRKMENCLLILHYKISFAMVISQNLIVFYNNILK